MEQKYAKKIDFMKMSVTIVLRSALDMDPARTAPKGYTNGSQCFTSMIKSSLQCI